MSEISSLFIATTVLAFGGLGLYMLKSDDTNEESNKEENNNEEIKEDEFIDNESEWFQDNKEGKHVKNVKTRRVRKKNKATRRKI